MLINYHIKNTQEEAYVNKIKSTLKKLTKENEINFWEFKTKLEGRPYERQKSMKDIHGEIKEDPEQILEIYKEFYLELFRKEIPSTEKAKEAEKLVNEKIREIEIIARNQTPLEVSRDELKECIKKQKKKKAPDREGWKK